MLHDEVQKYLFFYFVLLSFSFILRSYEIYKMTNQDISFSFQIYRSSWPYDEVLMDTDAVPEESVRAERGRLEGTFTFCAFDPLRSNISTYLSR